MRKKWEKSLHKRDILNLCSDNMSPLCSKPYGKYQKIFPKCTNNKLDIMSHFWGMKIFEVMGVNTADAPCTDKIQEVRMNVSDQIMLIIFRLSL